MVRTRFLLFAAVAAYGIPLFAQAPPTAKIVTPPKEHFGFELGDDYCLANYKQLESYWKKLEKQTDRLKVVSIGKTEEGRDQLMAVVSSPANIAKLDHYKMIARKLATAEATPEEAAKFAEEGKAVVWIDGGLHASEVLCAQVLCESVYRFVIATDPESLRILDDVIILFAHANPDGMDLVADWYMRNKDKAQRSLAGLPRLYEKYAGHDNNRDSYANNLAETRNMNRALYREWFPQICYDHHQTGPAGAVVFVPPCRDPNNYNLHPLVLNGIEQVCGAMVQRLIMENKPGITTRTGAGYSTWWNGGVITTCQFHNMIGFFTETIGGPTPTQIPLVTGKLLPNSDYLYPITPQPWRFKQSLEYSYSGNRGVLDYASRNKRVLLHNIWRMGQDMVDRGNRDHWTITPKMILAAGGRPNARGGGGGGRGGGGGGFGGGAGGAGDFAKFFRDPAKRDARAYVLPADQPDFLTAIKFVNTLLGNGCTVHKATAAFAVKDKSYPAGTLVVKTNQPFRAHVLDMFEPQDHPDDIPYPGAAPTAPYDAAGYTLAYTMGVKFDRVLDGLDPKLPLEVIKEEELKPAPGKVAGPANPRIYLLDTHANDAFRAVNRILKSGEKVGRMQQDAVVDGITFHAGTFVIPAGPNTRTALEKVAADVGVSFLGSDSPAGTGVKALKPVRVGLWDRYGGSMPVGWTRMILERFEFPFTLAYAPDLDKGNLKDRYDVLLFVEGGIPGGEGGGGFGGGGGGGGGRGGRGGAGGDNPNAPIPASATLPGEPMPPQGNTSVATTVPQLKKFLEAGGTIVTLGAATMASHVGYTVPRMPTVIGEDGQDRQPPREKYYIPSSVLRMKLDTSNSLAWGMDEYADTIFSNSPVFRVSDAMKAKGMKSVGWFDSKTPLRSGWAMGQDLLEKGTTVIDAPVGKGRLVMVGPQILFRGQPHGCYKLVFNAIVQSAVAE